MKSLSAGKGRVVIGLTPIAPLFASWSYIAQCRKLKAKMWRHCGRNTTMPGKKVTNTSSVWEVSNHYCLHSHVRGLCSWRKLWRCDGTKLWRYGGMKVYIGYLGRLARRASRWCHLTPSISDNVTQTERRARLFVGCSITVTYELSLRLYSPAPSLFPNQDVFPLSLAS